MSWLKQLWGFLQDLSGETALRRRMAAHACHDPACAAKLAMADEARERPRCC